MCRTKGESSDSIRLSLTKELRIIEVADEEIKIR